MTKEIENIIINKKFFELNAEERILIKEFAETEVDFDQLKFVFTQLEEVKKAEMPHVNRAIKSNLDVLFDKTFAQKRLVWYNKLWLFLWPEETRFYARPLVQFATVLVLIVSVITLVPFSEKPQLAVNDSKVSSLNEKSDGELVKVEDLKEEKVEEDLNQPIEKRDNKALEIPKMESQNGWELAKAETPLTDGLAKESLEHDDEESFHSGASDAVNFSLNSPVKDVSFTNELEDVTLSRSVTTSQPKPLSPKESSEVFDILTALY